MKIGGKQKRVKRMEAITKNLLNAEGMLFGSPSSA